MKAPISRTILAVVAFLITTVAVGQTKLGQLNTADRTPLSDGGIEARYAAEIMRSVESKWIRSKNVKESDVCKLLVVQVPGGEVVLAEALPDCPYDKIDQEAAIRAVFQASPLPYVGYESVFRRRLVLRFRALNRASQ